MGQRQRVFGPANGFAHPHQHHQVSVAGLHLGAADEMAAASPGCGEEAAPGAFAAWESEWIDLGGEG